MSITLTIDVPKKLSGVSQDDLQRSISLLLQEYTEFDIHLLRKYMQVRNLPDSRFVSV